MGYTSEDVRLAAFAVVALLDESALNARQPALADWARRPLQDELFGGHLAGEWFFQHVEQLLARPDSAALADVLEVHQLVLLLGFRGRYGHEAPPPSSSPPRSGAPAR
jgi:type VI secretion system protein ImpK